jgi:predicted DNA-binding transcriptional regulator YafY
VLACAARDLISKIAAVVPKRLRPFVAEPSIGVPTSQALAVDGFDIARTRLWIRSGRKIRILYKDEQSRETERTIWPTIIGYAETVHLLAACCELRQGFRHFRTDRIVSAAFLQEPCEWRPRELRARWQRNLGQLFPFSSNPLASCISNAGALKSVPLGLTIFCFQGLPPGPDSLL